MRLHLARGGVGGGVGSAYGRLDTRRGEKGPAMSTYNQGGGRRLRRAGLSIWKGRKRRERGIPSSSADSESASCASSPMAEGLITRREGKGGWLTLTHC